MHPTRTTMEKAMAPNSSTLAWKIPWMEKPGRLQSMRSLRVGHDWAISLWLFTFMHWRRKWQPTPVFLPGGSQGGLPSMGSHRLGHDWSDLAAAGAPQYVRQMPTSMKGEINSNTIIVGDLKTSLTPMDRSTKQKISKETQTLNDTMDQLDLIEIYRTFTPKQWISPFSQVHTEHSPG